MFDATYFKDLAERVVTTFLLTFIGLLATATVLDADSLQVAAISGVAAVLSLIKNIVTELAGASNGGTWWQDALLRTLWTYIQVYIGIVVVNGTLDIESLKPAAIAAIPAALGVLKGFLASRLTDPTTAGFLTKGDHELAA